MSGIEWKGVKLTLKQFRIFTFIYKYHKEFGAMPTLVQVSEYFNLTPQNIGLYFRNFIRKNLFKKLNHKKYTFTNRGYQMLKYFRDNNLI